LKTKHELATTIHRMQGEKKIEIFTKTFLKIHKKMLQEFIHPLILSSTQHLTRKSEKIKTKKIKFVFHLVLLG